MPSERRNFFLNPKKIIAVCTFISSLERCEPGSTAHTHLFYEHRFYADTIKDSLRTSAIGSQSNRVLATRCQN